MESIKVSVVIPSYNRYTYLINAIESVESQTYKNIEIIVVNDGSTDQRYFDPELERRAKVIHIDRNNTPNWGGSRPAVRNYGIEISTGKYVAFLDDDDIWFPKKIETQLNSMIHNKLGFSCTEGYFGYGPYSQNKIYLKYNSEHHFKKIKKQYKSKSYFKNNRFPSIWTYDFLIQHNSVVLSSVIVETEILKQLGGFRGLYRSNYFRHTADHDCWLGLLQLTNLVYIDTPLFYYDAAHGDGKNYKN